MALAVWRKPMPETQGHGRKIKPEKLL